MLGVGDFYYELGVQAVEICIATRPQNGGIMTLSELQQRYSMQFLVGKFWSEIKKKLIWVARQLLIIYSKYCVHV